MAAIVSTSSLSLLDRISFAVMQYQLPSFLTPADLKCIAVARRSFQSIFDRPELLEKSLIQSISARPLVSCINEIYGCTSPKEIRTLFNFLMRYGQCAELPKFPVDCRVIGRNGPRLYVSLPPPDQYIVYRYDAETKTITSFLVDCMRHKYGGSIRLYGDFFEEGKIYYYAYTSEGYFIIFDSNHQEIDARQICRPYSFAEGRQIGNVVELVVEIRGGLEYLYLMLNRKNVAEPSRQLEKGNCRSVAIHKGIGIVNVGPGLLKYFSISQEESKKREAGDKKLVMHQEWTYPSELKWIDGIHFYYGHFILQSHVSAIPNQPYQVNFEVVSLTGKRIARFVANNAVGISNHKVEPTYECAFVGGAQNHICLPSSLSIPYASFAWLPPRLIVEETGVAAPVSEEMRSEVEMSAKRFCESLSAKSIILSDLVSASPRSVIGEINTPSFRPPRLVAITPTRRKGICQKIAILFKAFLQRCRIWLKGLKTCWTRQRPITLGANR